MLAAHAAYLAHMRTRALLDGSCDGFRATLAAIFDTAAQLLHPLRDCEAHAAACAATQGQARPSLRTRTSPLPDSRLHAHLELRCHQVLLSALCTSNPPQRNVFD